MTPRDGAAVRDAGVGLPIIAVACTTAGCPARGAVIRVMLRPVTPGLVEMPRLLCSRCGLEPAVVRPWPSEGEDMPKITVHGGASNAADLPNEGGEETSPGNSSSTSSEKPETSPAKSASRGRSRARTTESRSAKARTGSSTAPRTDGGQTAPTSQTSSGSA